MDLAGLSNAELIERFEAIDPLLGDAPNPEVVDALATLGDLNGFDDEDNSRQILSNYIREEESSRQPKTKRRTEGGRRRIRKSRKSRKSRKGIKSRKGRKSRR